jgi:hypothetical protein
LIFGEGDRKINERKSSFSTLKAGTTECPHANNTLSYSSKSHTKFDAKWIMNPNVKTKMIKFPGKLSEEIFRAWFLPKRSQDKNKL